MVCILEQSKWIKETKRRLSTDFRFKGHVQAAGLEISSHRNEGKSYRKQFNQQNIPSQSKVKTAYQTLRKQEITMSASWWRRLADVISLRQQDSASGMNSWDFAKFPSHLSESLPATHDISLPQSPVFHHVPLSCHIGSCLIRYFLCCLQSMLQYFPLPSYIAVILHSKCFRPYWSFLAYQFLEDGLRR